MKNSKEIVFFVLIRGEERKSLSKIVPEPYEEEKSGPMIQFDGGENIRYFQYIQSRMNFYQTSAKFTSGWIDYQVKNVGCKFLEQMYSNIEQCKYSFKEYRKKRKDGIEHIVFKTDRVC